MWCWKLWASWVDSGLGCGAIRGFSIATVYCAVAGKIGQGGRWDAEVVKKFITTILSVYSKVLNFLGVDSMLISPLYSNTSVQELVCGLHGEFVWLVPVDFPVMPEV